MAFGLGRASLSSSPIFEEFDLTTGDLSILEIVEKSGGGNCFVRSKDGQHYYGSFVLDKNRETTTLCDLQFYRSSTTNCYIPRPKMMAQIKLVGEMLYELTSMMAKRLKGFGS